MTFVYAIEYSPWLVDAICDMGLNEDIRLACLGTHYVQPRVC
jgi:hypothetical protein